MDHLDIFMEQCRVKDSSFVAMQQRIAKKVDELFFPEVRLQEVTTEIEELKSRL